MVHRLAAVISGVDDRPVAGLGDALTARDLGRQEERLTEEIPCLRLGRVEGRDVLPRDDQDVERSLWADVPEREQALPLVNERGRDRARRDSAEETVG